MAAKIYNDAQSMPNMPPPLPEPPPLTTTIHINGNDDVKTTTTATTTATTLFNKSTNITTRSSVGVQNLRNLWNQRIMANKAQQLYKQKQQQQQQHDIQHLNDENTNKRTQSISALHKISNNQQQQQNNLNFSIRGAQSLNDCTKIELTTILRERDRLHREKDNFYKYKTAEQAARLSRNEINVKRNLNDEEQQQQPKEQHQQQQQQTKVYYSTKIDIKPTTPPLTPLPPLPPPRANKQQESATDDVTKIESTFNNETCNTDDACTEKSVNNTIANTNMQRRYSFKTHTKCYPLGGKVCKDTGVSGNGNRVARLTQRFNALVQNDDSVFDEVKRNNGVLMSRGNHVYKVIENTERTKNSPAKRTNSYLSSRVQHQIKHFEQNLETNVMENVETTTTQPPLVVEEKLEAPDLVQAVQDAEAHKSKQRKQKYAKIYEKFRIRSPFSSPKNKNNKAQEQEPEKPKDPEILEHATDENLKNILNALQAVDEKLKDLQTEDNTTTTTTTTETTTTALSLNENNDFEQIVVPNSSFLHQTHKNEHLNTNITQAVNIILVNSLNSKTQVPTIPENEEDSVYEPIADLKCQQERELADDYESIEETQEHALLTIYNGSNDSYESLELSAPEIPAPPVPVLYTQLSRNTNDELPEIPKPKRRLPKSPMPGKRLTKSILPSKVYRQNFYDSQLDKDNIYCTIKGAYESLSCVTGKEGQPLTYVKTADTISLKSNGYERIQNFRCNPTHTNNKYASSSCGSTLTISSDHKTNSLYEPSLAAQLDLKSSSIQHDRLSVCSTIICEATPVSRCGSTDGSTLACGNYSLLNIAASDNSDDWIDMTDTDDASSYAKITPPQFIV